MGRNGWIISWMTRGGIYIVHVSFFNVAVPLRQRKSFGALPRWLKLMADLADFGDGNFSWRSRQYTFGAYGHVKKRIIHFFSCRRLSHFVEGVLCSLVPDNEKVNEGLKIVRLHQQRLKL